MRSMTKTALLCGALMVGSAAWGQANPSSFTHAMRYDAARRVTGTIAPDPDGGGSLRYLAVRNTYDTGGRLIRVEKGQLQNWQSQDVAPVNWSGFDVYSQVDIDYDLMNRKTVERTSGGGVQQAVTQYSYNDQGLLECTAVRMNPDVFNSPLKAACTLGATGAQGPDRITRNEYDAAGQLLRVIRAYGTDLQQTYATYTYSPNGKRTSVKDANGNLSKMGYDGFDRQVTWVFPSKTSAGQTADSDIDYCNKENSNVAGGDYEAYCYDVNGNRTRLRRRDGRVLTFAYDALNRMTSKVVADDCAPIHTDQCAPSDTTRDVYYGYDLRGLQTYARFDNITGEGVTTAYDGFGAVVSSTTAMDGQSRTLSYRYDADGNRTKITHPDNVAFDMSYDGLDRLAAVRQPDGTWITSIDWNTKGLLDTLNKVAAKTSYEYDGVGRLNLQAQSLASSGVTTKLEYNAASQIASESRNNDAYAFTGRYNVSRGYGVNGQNQYTTAGPASFTYDANGNLVSDGSTSYVYDGENRLVSSSRGVSLRYDPLGRLWQVSGPSGTTRFLYDGDQLTAEYDANGTMLRRYVHGVGEDDPFVWYEGSGLGDRRSLMADHQGSVVAVVDASGNPVRINAYDEYGIPKSDNLGRFQYTGQAFLSELGMYHYKARIYSPTLGRFLQTDPIGYDDQINLYAYVANDPVNGRDPDGTTGEFFQRAADVLFGTAEVAVGAIGTVTGAALTTAGTVTEVGSAGVLTPVSLPAIGGGVVLIGGSIVVANDGRARIVRGLTGSSGPTISETRGNRGGQGRGERGQAAKPSGSGNAGKHANAGKGYRTDNQTGKKIPLPPPPPSRPPEPERSVKRGKKPSED